ncbi:transmembrane protein, putative (macronuclear) [Tetrahymena thermophila SB210]|uniref:Transmembrane protein, putative n=1 Tax=Tetrahymena thermophila (strain SB210) TaxID=312017 RepID=W7XIG8_TETTS|nr:transmembrane protein, putative [Tetrahymena thermophila SB210]EWS74626.1 transmembrane protein, putative [Tetrahymena thermophila SB210]|eukprot:XP_012652848.1 transmembrane protein, putative [Tetrahymena thermophila SB210]
MGLRESLQIIFKFCSWFYFKTFFYGSFQSSKVGILALLIKDFGLKNDINQDLLSFTILMTVSISLLINEFLLIKFIQKRIIEIILEIASFIFILLISLNLIVYLQIIIACFIMTTNFCSLVNLLYNIYPTIFRYNIVMVIIMTVIFSAMNLYMSSYSINTGSYIGYEKTVVYLLAGFYAFSQFVNFFLQKNIKMDEDIHNRNEQNDFLYTQETFDEKEMQQINKCKKFSMIFLIFIVGFNVNYYSIANLTQNFSMFTEIIYLFCFQILFSYVQVILVIIFPILDLTNIFIFLNIMVVAQLQLVINNMYLRSMFLTIIFGQPILFQMFFRQYTGFIQPNKWIKIILAVSFIFYSINDLVVKYLVVGVNYYSLEMKEINFSFQAYQISLNCLSLALIFTFEIYLKKQLPQSYQRSILNLQL